VLRPAPAHQLSATIDGATESGVWLGLLGSFLAVLAGEQIIGSLTRKSLTVAPQAVGYLEAAAGGVVVGTAELLVMQANVNTVLGCSAFALGSLVMRRRLRRKIRKFGY
jgi:hypothetical protein